MSNHNQHRPGLSAEAKAKAGYKHTPLGWIPEEWEVKHLQSVTKSFRSRNGITSEAINDKGEFPVYGSRSKNGCLPKGTWILNNQR
jgi:hypothetical protein